MSEDIANVTLSCDPTPEMLDAGEHAVLCEVGGGDLGGYFSARDLAAEVYRVMRRAADHIAKPEGKLQTR